MSLAPVRRFLGLVTIVLLAAPELRADDWPFWRGPQRDGTTTEDSGWDDGGWPPPVAWSARVGAGSSSVLVVGGRVFGIGRRGGGETVYCLDAATGGELWHRGYEAPDYGRHSTGDKNFYGGPSATPEFDPATGLLYTLGIDGDLRCWDTKAEGAAVWELNLYDAYGIPQRPQVTPRGGSLRDYGCATAPLVRGDFLLVGAGDPKRGNILAFDKRTGKLAWGSEDKDAGGHAGGLVPVTVAGRPCVVSFTARRVVVTEILGGSGREVCAVPWATDFINNIATPAVLPDGSVVVTSEYNVSATARLRPQGGRMERVWERAECAGVCSPVVDGDFLYLGGNGLRCLDARGGELLWSGGKLSEACSLVLTGDRRLIVWANDGDLLLVEGASRAPEAFTVLAEQKGLLRDMAWPHVALADGRLFCKDRSGNLKCLALGREARALVARAEPVPGATPTAPVKTSGFDLSDWPAGNPEPALAWKKGGGRRAFVGTLGRAGRWSLAARGEATVDADGSLRAHGGGFTVAGDREALCEAFRSTGALTLEIVFTAADLDQEGPARILTFSESPFSRNFTLGQERDALVFRVRTPATGENGMSPESVLGHIDAGQPYHCLVSYGGGTLACYLNGAEVYRESGRVTGDFSNWTTQHLLVGDEWGESRPWRGRVEGFAFFPAATDASVAARRFRELARP